MTYFYKKDGFVNEDNLRTIIHYFENELIEEWNQKQRDEKKPEIDFLDHDPKFDQWCVDRITNIFNN